MSLLPTFQIFKRTLGLWESASGLGASRATKATANISNVQKDTGPSEKCQWPRPLRLFLIFLIFQISNFKSVRLLPIVQVLKKDIWLSRKCQWPRNVHGPWGYCQYYKYSKGHCAIGKVPVGVSRATEAIAITYIQFNILGVSRATEAIAITYSKGHWAIGKCQWPGSVPGHWG